MPPKATPTPEPAVPDIKSQLQDAYNKGNADGFRDGAKKAQSESAAVIEKLESDLAAARANSAPQGADKEKLRELVTHLEAVSAEQRRNSADSDNHRNLIFELEATIIELRKLSE